MAFSGRWRAFTLYCFATDDHIVMKSTFFSIPDDDITCRWIDFANVELARNNRVSAAQQWSAMICVEGNSLGCC